MNSVRVYVTRETKILPATLAEEATAGQTIIEKFETHGEQSSYLIVLLTPDDVGQTVGEHDAGNPLRPKPDGTSGFEGQVDTDAAAIVSGGRDVTAAETSMIDTEGLTDAANATAPRISSSRSERNRATLEGAGYKPDERASDVDMGAPEQATLAATTAPRDRPRRRGYGVLTRVRDEAASSIR